MELLHLKIDVKSDSKDLTYNVNELTDELADAIRLVMGQDTVWVSVQIRQHDTIYYRKHVAGSQKVVSHNN